MAGLESKLQTRCIDFINCNGGYCRNIHGNVYQSGIPDLAVTTKHGVTFFCELKIWRNINPPRHIDSVLRLLRKEQRLFTTKTWECGGYCPILAVTPDGAEDFREGLSYLCDGQTFNTSFPIAHLAYLLCLKHGDFV